MSTLHAAATLAVLALLQGCNVGREGQAFGQYAPNMHDEPMIKPQGVNRLAQLADSGSANMPIQGSRTPPPGTLPVDYVPFRYPKGSSPDSVEALRQQIGREMPNPLPVSETVLKRGQFVYENYCLVCHGPQGRGDGTIVPPYPKPSISLQGRKIREYPDGAIFHVVWHGGQTMPSYSKQLLSQDIWALIRYLRVLQTAYGKADDIDTAATQAAATTPAQGTAKAAAGVAAQGGLPGDKGGATGDVSPATKASERPGQPKTQPIPGQGSKQP